ncbi:MAG: hypothetical protein CME62_07595 [Halobacteriovoraceae bacterium]|nr:hypothetical protein [Halobacteriovoraceae bacterium]|tara:strand:- start:14727 stop:15602 length:876 start_codon:yes stop_codon:yes gene_type:complete
MKTMIVLTLSCLALIACNGGSGGSGSGDKVKVQQFLSPHNPCNISKCSGVQKITYNEAIKLYENSDLTPVKGLKITQTITEDDAVYKYNNETDEWSTTNCTVEFDQEKLLVDFDEKYFYIEELKKNLKVAPESTTCLGLLTDGSYPAKEIAFESRLDKTGIKTDDLFKKMHFEKFNLNGEQVIRVSGKTTGTYEVEKGITFEFSFDTIISLDRHSFHSSVFSHNISKQAGSPAYSFIDVTKSYSEGHDVSHVDISTIDICSMDNRSQDEIACPNNSTNNTSSNSQKISLFK